jgi:hypothetical protein
LRLKQLKGGGRNRVVHIIENETFKRRRQEQGCIIENETVKGSRRNRVV